MSMNLLNDILSLSCSSESSARDSDGDKGIALGLAQIFGFNPASGETGAMFDLFNDAMGMVAGLGNGADDLPDAHLQYLFFDENFQFVAQAGKGYDYVQVDQGAEVTFATNPTHAHDSLELVRVFDQPGFLFVYVSNNSPGSQVYFDDLTITHKLSPIEQLDDYRPFGLTFNSYQSGVGNRYQFQGQEHQDETGWDIFKWRNSDPSIGRFFNIDPLAESFYYNSTYAFSENKVVSHIELEGLEAVFFQAEARVSIPMAGAYGITGSAAYGAAFDFEGNVALYQTYSFGGQVGAGANAGVGVGVNPLVENVNGLEGWGANVGFFASPSVLGSGFGVEGNVTIPAKEQDFTLNNIPSFLTDMVDLEGDFGGGATFSFGPTAGISAYAEGAYTDFFTQFNIFEESDKLGKNLGSFYDNLSNDAQNNIDRDSFINQMTEFINGNVKMNKRNKGLINEELD